MNRERLLGLAAHRLRHIGVGGLVICVAMAVLVAPVDAKRPELCPDRSPVKADGTCDFPYGGFRAPEIGDYSAFDRDGNKIDDRLDAKLEKLSPSDRITVIVDLFEPPTQAMLDHLNNSGGTLRHVYRYAGYGFSGNISVGRLKGFVNGLGGALNHLTEAVRQNITLSWRGYQMRARPIVWQTYGIEGSTNDSIAVLDQGQDDTHPSILNFQDQAFDNLSVKIVGWTDQVTGSNLATPRDVGGHGTSTASIAAGSGDPDVNSTNLANVTFWWSFASDTSTERRMGINVTHSGTASLCLYQGANKAAHIHLRYSNGTSVTAASGSESGSTEPICATYSVGPGFYDAVAHHDDPFLDSKQFNLVMYYPHNNTRDPYPEFRGVAPKNRVVGVRVLDDAGSGSSDEVNAGIDWLVANKQTYRITVASASLGTGCGSFSNQVINNAAQDQKADNVVANGIVFVAAAGNGHPSCIGVGSPANATKAIAVAAVDYMDNITEYSSNGKSGQVKPEIAGPSSSRPYPTFSDLGIIAADTNDADSDGSISDLRANDYALFGGTSAATPHVAGAAALVIAAMNRSNTGEYGWNESSALKVKSILLMTAHEVQAGKSGNSPTLDRGGWDKVEGFGRVNADAAVEAVLFNYTVGTVANKSNSNASLCSGIWDKKVWARKVSVTEGLQHKFTLNTSPGADFDLYLYDSTPDSVGDPVILAKSVSATPGVNETAAITPPSNKTIYVVVKWVSGCGEFNLTSETLAPVFPDIVWRREMPENVGNSSNVTVRLLVYNNKSEDITVPIVLEETIPSPGWSLVSVDQGDADSSDTTPSWTFNSLEANRVKTVSYRVQAPSTGWNASNKTAGSQWGADCSAVPDACDALTLGGIACSPDEAGTFEKVRKVEINKTVAGPGSDIEATCTFDNAGDAQQRDQAWYYNGNTWYRVYYCASGCGVSANYTKTFSFTLNNTPGEHVIRCGTAYTETVTNACSNAGNFYDNDEVNVTVLSHSFTSTLNYGIFQGDEKFTANFTNDTAHLAFDLDADNSTSGVEREIQKGKTWNMNLTVTNAGNQTATSPRVNLTLPRNFTGVTSANGTLSGGGSENWTLTWDLPDIAVGAKVNLSFTATCPATTEAFNLTANWTNGSEVQGLFVRCYTKWIEVTGAATNLTQTSEGQPFNVTATLWNDNDTAVSNVNASLTLPSNTNLLSGSLYQTNASMANNSAWVANWTVNATLCDQTYTFTVTANATINGQLREVSNTTNAISISCTAVTITPALSPDELEPGELSNLTVDLFNGKTTALTDIETRLTPPSGWTSNNTTGPISPDLASQGTSTYTFNLTAPSGAADGLYSATLTLNYTEADGNRVNNTRTLAIRVGAPALEVVREQVSKAGVSKTITTKFTIKSTGTAGAYNVTFNETLPSNWTFGSADSGGTFSSPNVTWSISKMSFNENDLVTYTATSPARDENSTFCHNATFENGKGKKYSIPAGDCNVVNVSDAAAAWFQFATAEATIYPNQSKNITLNVTNVGSQKLAAGWNVSLEFPAGGAWSVNTSAISDSGTFSSPYLNWSNVGPELGPSASKSPKLAFEASTTNGTPRVEVFRVTGNGTSTTTAETRFEDDFETDRGWTVSSTATAGLFARADPVLDIRTNTVQPEDDTTVGGVNALFTGPSATSDDVDGGFTNATSPAFDLSGASSAILTYNRWWYADGTTDDVFEVLVSNNGGSSWTLVEQLTGSTTTNVWTPVQFDLGAITTLTSNMKLRVSVADTSTATIVEGGIDNVKILTKAPSNTSKVTDTTNYKVTGSTGTTFVHGLDTGSIPGGATDPFLNSTLKVRAWCVRGSGAGRTYSLDVSRGDGTEGEDPMTPRDVSCTTTNTSTLFSATIPGWKYPKNQSEGTNIRIRMSASNSVDITVDQVTYQWKYNDTSPTPTTASQNLSLTVLAPAVTLTRGVTTYSGACGAAVDVSLTMTNTGNDNATSLVLNESIDPALVDVTDTTNLTMLQLGGFNNPVRHAGNNTLVWSTTANLTPGESRTVAYRMKTQPGAEGLRADGVRANLSLNDSGDVNVYVRESRADVDVTGSCVSVSIDSPAASSAHNSDIPVSVTVTSASGIAYVEASLSNDTAPGGGRNFSRTRLTPSGGSAYTGTLSVAGLADGNYTLFVNVSTSGGVDYNHTNTTGLNILIDRVPPVSSRVSENTTSINEGGSVNLSAFWDENFVLSSWWLSTNESGAWVNRTPQAFSGGNWSNVTWTNASVEGKRVYWRIYANDTAGNVNSTETRFFKVNSVAPNLTFFANNTSLVAAPWDEGFWSKEIVLSNGDYEHIAYYNASTSSWSLWYVRWTRGTSDTSGTNFSLVPGRGYSASAWSPLNYTRWGVRPDTVTTTLYNGWNLVTSLTDTTADGLCVAINTSCGTGYITDVVRKLNESGYSSTWSCPDQGGTNFPVQSSEGFWVKVNGSTSCDWTQSL